MFSLLQFSALLSQFFVLFALTTGCSTVPLSKSKPEAITVMAYNVENLFDTLPDTDREDYTYLPLSYKKANPEHKVACQTMSNDYYKKECLETDWNEALLERKLERLKDTILQIDGKGPDILLVEEVENIRVLHLLADRMPEAQYQTRVLLEGDDRRGIDVGVLSRFPLAGEVQLHRIDFTPDSSNPNWKKPATRGLLEVPLKLPTGEKLTVIPFHFPSQSNPVQQRRDAVNSLNKILATLGPQEMVIAGGDSNITAVEDFKDGLQSKILAESWLVSHKQGCLDCRGTHYYKGEWSFLDILLFSKNLSSEGGSAPYQLLPRSIQVPRNGRYQLKFDGTTSRFSEGSFSTGVSDHLPIYGELIRRP